MVKTKNVPLLTKAAEAKFAQRCKLSDEMATLNKRIATLKQERNQLDTVLQERWFEEDCPVRLRGGNLVVLHTITVDPIVVTPDMVGETIKQGYSFIKFDIIAG